MKNALRSLLFGCLLFLPAAVITLIPLRATADASADEAMYQQAGSRTLIASHQKDEEVGCQDAASGNNVSPDRKAAPGHENPSREGREAERDVALCPEDAGRQESLLHRILCFFVAPVPSGPNPDVDTNISAGGAGGG